MERFPLISRALSVLGHLIRRVECHIRYLLSVASTYCVLNSQDTFAATLCSGPLAGVPVRIWTASRPSKSILLSPFVPIGTFLRPRLLPDLFTPWTAVLARLLSCLAARGPRPPPPSLPVPYSARQWLLGTVLNLLAIESRRQ